MIGLSYGMLIVWSLLEFGTDIQRNLSVAAQPTIGQDTLHGGLVYAGYNIIAFTSVLFVIRQLPSRLCY